jgi:hypothetical protein
MSWLFRSGRVVAVLDTLASLMLPALSKAKQKVGREYAIMNNLRLLDSAKQQWALEQRKSATDVPTMEDLRPYVGRGERGEVPGGEGQTYILGAVGEPPVARLKSRWGEDKIVTLPGQEVNLMSLLTSPRPQRPRQCQSAAERAGNIGVPSDTPIAAGTARGTATATVASARSGSRHQPTSGGGGYGGDTDEGEAIKCA